MKIRSRFLVLCLGLCWFASPVQAKRKHHGSPPAPSPATPTTEPASLPTETAPAIRPDAPPSESLQPFMDQHLGKILAPLGVSAFAQSEVIASLRASYADGMAAALANHRPAYLAAQSVCAALAGAITERQTAVTALRGALATRNSEATQPRGGEADGAAKTRLDDAFFTNSQTNAWTQRAEALRQSISALYLRERQTERQIGAWYPPPPTPPPAPVASVPAAPAAAPVAAATPSVSVPPAATPPPPLPGQDPVVGAWNWQGYQTVDVGANNTINGSRHGRWYFISNMSGGRYYEFHWQKHGAVDYVVLAADGRKLEGKNGDQKYVYAERR